jgi:hypothetical protein
MTALAYTRFELVRTFRNFRLLIFSLGFPLILFFVIAGPRTSTARGSRCRSTTWSAWCRSGR